MSVAAQENSNARVVPIQVTGDPEARFVLVILGDGYTTAEMPRFRQHVEKHLNILWSLEPFRSYRSYINVYAVEIPSGQSGITCDPAHREPRTTPLGLRFGGGCENPNARGINAEAEAARTFARMATPHYDQILVIANTDTYGGIGGAIATTSGGNSLGPYITPHELGHSLGRLQDEYTYSARGVAGPAFTRTEPNSIHHTLIREEQMRAQQLKWWRWLGEPSESGGAIGRYEGGQSSVSGVWRPSKHSMMISLGYYFDQVSRERMAQRISGQVQLIAASWPEDIPLNFTQVVWIETPHPVFHDLNVTWEVDGQAIPNTNNSRSLTLGSLRLAPGQHRVTVKVVDPTDFVRDPVIRDTSFSASRSWLVGEAAVTPPSVRVAFKASTQTGRAVSGNEVVHVETTHPVDRVLTVTWRLDGRVVKSDGDGRTLNLARQNLNAGRHQLTATVTDPGNAGGASQTLTWTVDNTGPTVTQTLSQPVSVVDAPGGVRHYFMRDQFTMKLDPADDQPGYVVAEFRVNGDGWHHYYGWPDAAPGTPFLFTPRGTTIKELVYGSLSSEGLSPQPWEAREPGWGTHRVEYRARDAAGNVGATREFRVTFMPAPTCTATITGQHSGELNVSSGITCLNGATVTGAVSVSAGASLSAVNAVIQGPLTATNATLVELIGTAVAGAVRIDGTTDRLTLFGNRLARALACGGNNPNRLNLVSNTVRGGTSGQCAAVSTP
ncbi:MAG: M64 family metallopeptidase [Longimicrobiales bacterium]